MPSIEPTDNPPALLTSAICNYNRHPVHNPEAEMGATSTKVRLDVHNSEIPELCRSCEARHGGVCGVLTADQLLYLAKHSVKQTYDSGEELVATGQRMERYANIMSGVVKLTKLLADGRQQVVGLQFAPDFLGRPYAAQSTHTAEAATRVRVCSFPRSVIEEILRKSPEMERRLHEQCLSELDEARDWLLALGRKSASEKVASFLFMIASNVDPEQEPDNLPVRFELPLRRADIADFLGLTIETVSRHLTKLRKAGLVRIENNRTITVPDMAKLFEACETSA
jgi:CRP/FNR family transcriptional regulator